MLLRNVCISEGWHHNVDNIDFNDNPVVRENGHGLARTQPTQQ